MNDELPPTKADEPVIQSEVKKEQFIALPPGIPVGGVRGRLGESAQLFFQLERDNENDLTPLHFGYGPNEYVLHPGVKYVVGVGGKRHGMLYLNPLSDHEGVPDESNIPLVVDRELSAQETRSRFELRLLVSSPDGDILKAIDEYLDFEQYEQAFQQFHQELERLGGQERVLEILHESSNRNGFAGIAVGQGFDFLLPDWFGFSATTRFAENIKSGSSEDNPLSLIEQDSNRFFSWLKATVIPRVDQLTANLDGENTIAFAFDEYFWDANEPDIGSLMVITYIPGVGWSIASPNVNCPNQAATALDNLMRGDVGSADFPELNSTIEAAVSAEELTVDTEQRVLIYTAKDKLLTNEAVFHGDMPLVRALEALKGMGDPIVGEDLFDFKQILFLNTTEFDNKPKEYFDIDISFG